MPILRNGYDWSSFRKVLATTNPQLLEEFEDAKHDADATSKFLRESARCPLTSRGDINTYSVFAETTRNIISQAE